MVIGQCYIPGSDAKRAEREMNTVNSVSDLCTILLKPLYYAQCLPVQTFHLPGFAQGIDKSLFGVLVIAIAVRIS